MISALLLSSRWKGEGRGQSWVSFSSLGASCSYFYIYLGSMLEGEHTDKAAFQRATAEEEKGGEAFFKASYTTLYMILNNKFLFLPMAVFAGLRTCPLSHHN